MISLRTLWLTPLLLVVGCGQQAEVDAAAAGSHVGAVSEPCESRDAGYWQDPAARRVGLLEQFYRHFAGQNAFGVTGMLPDDMTWNVIGWREQIVPFAGQYVGRRQIRDLFRNYFAAIRIEKYQFEYKLAEGDYVNWHFRLVAKVPSTGKTFDAEFVHVWRFGTDGKPVSCRAYYDTQLMVDAFSMGGPTELVDRKNLSDDFKVKPTSEDVEGLVATLYDLFYAGDIPTVFGMLSDDVYVYFQGKDNPQSGEYHGFAGVQQFVMNLAGTAYPYQIERFYVTEGDRTDVVLFENWTVYATGKSYHVHTVNSWRLNDQGKLMGFINYPDVDEVAAAYVP